MDVNLTGVLIAGMICISTLGIVIVPMVIDFKLKKAQIQADEKVRIEEVNARNRLEIEKLVMGHETDSSRGEAGRDMFMGDVSQVREKKKE